MRMSGCLPFSRVCSFCREDLRVVNMMEFINCAWLARSRLRGIHFNEEEDHN